MYNKHHHCLIDMLKGFFVLFLLFYAPLNLINLQLDYLYGTKTTPAMNSEQQQQKATQQQ